MKRVIGFSLFGLVVVVTLMGCALYSENKNRYAGLNNFRDGVFKNAVEVKGDRSFGKIVRAITTTKRGPWPSWIENTSKPRLADSRDHDTTVVTFINHATFLLESDGIRTLIDPVFSKSVGPYGKIGAKRRRLPGMDIDDIPKIDVILISHNHYDHLDLPALKQLSQKYNPIVLVPLGDKQWLEKKGISRVEELNWWDTIEVSTDYSVTFVPAQHSSGRGLFDRDHSLWGGWVVSSSNKNIFHAGDTGFSNHFIEIGNRFKIDLALMPIGAYAPTWFLNYVHMTPEQAIAAHIDIGAERSFGMHYETFRLSSEGFDDPMKDLKRAKQAVGQKADNFDVIEVGQSFRF